MTDYAARLAEEVPDAKARATLLNATARLTLPLPTVLPDYLQRARLPQAEWLETQRARGFELLKVLHRDGYRDLRAFRADKTTSKSPAENVPVADLEAVERFARRFGDRFDLYAGVAERRGPRGGNKENCSALHALYADLDFKLFASEAEARARLEAFPLKPSAVVQSGGGLQVYFLLSEPLLLDKDNGISFAEALLKSLAAMLGADPAVAEVARVLRLPGTLNRKYDPPRPVAVEFLDTSRRCALTDLTGVLPLNTAKTDAATTNTEPVKHGVSREAQMRLARLWLENQPPGIEGEHGDERTHRMCCAVAVGFDLVADDAYEVMKAWNARCEPPWAESALRQKIRGAVGGAKERRGGRLTFRRDKTKKGKPLPILPNNQWNIWLGLAKLDAVLGFDAFAQKPRARWGEYDGPLEDAIRDDLWLAFDERLRFRPSPEFFDTVIKKVARSNTYHPVRQYLDTLRWDGVPRLDAWLVAYAGAVDTKYVRAVGAKPLIAAVQRVRKPGCKFDELVVLESEQGKLKSTALRVLCPNEDWFSDDLPLGADAKEIIERTAGKWIIEASELYGNERDVERLKSMLSRQVDGPCRLAYARLPVEVPRQWIGVGTTNARSGYIRDSTGARRFWPVRVKQFDIARLQADRDQLWAEAAQREAKGESIRLDPSLYGDAAQEQEQRRLVDPWEELIVDGLDLDGAASELEYVEASRVWAVLGSIATNRDNRHAARVEKIMQRLGYPTKKRVWGTDQNRDRKKRWVWFREGAAEQGEFEWSDAE